MIKPRLVLRRLLSASFVVLSLGCLLKQPLRAEDKTPAALDAWAHDFWQWRALYQPYSADDIPRIDRPAGPRDWSASSIAAQKAALAKFEKQWQQIDAKGWSVPQQVDYRLMGSALARVRWELEINPRWQRDPSFYVDQTMTALLEALVEPPPFNGSRSREIVERMQKIPQILESGKANLNAVRPFAVLAIGDLQQIRPELERVEHEVAPMLHDHGSAQPNIASQFQAATQKAILALESYRTWLQAQLPTMPENAAVGRENYEFFLRHVAVLPYSPEQLLAISRQEWDRSVAFEQYEKQRNQGPPELKLAASLQEQIERSTRDELAIRKFLEEKSLGWLTNIVLSSGQSLQERGDGCWRVPASGRDCN